MTPSTNQNNTAGDNYDVWERAFEGRIDIEPLLRGINSEERALEAHRKAHEYDAPTRHKKAIAEILREYK